VDARDTSAFTRVFDALCAEARRRQDFHGAFQPHLDEMQHAPVNNSARYRLY
jgi:hypothetical protein